jgi:hypothetical protein
MKHRITLAIILTSFLAFWGCPKEMPPIDLGGVDPAFLQGCQDTGVLVVSDERYEDYWARGYDTTKARLLAQSGKVTESMTLPTAVRRRLLRILNQTGVGNASTFEVVHYRPSLPPVEINVWGKSGEPRDIQVNDIQTESLADWPCCSRPPRRTTFRIITLKPGDTVEIIQPLCDADRDFWRFGSERFCVLQSRAVFGHPHDTGSTILDMDSVAVDFIGAVAKTSPAGKHPVVYEIKRPLPTLGRDKLPYVFRSYRCQSWEHLHGLMFHSALWMARDGMDVTAENVPRRLTKAVETGQRLQRITEVADWLEKIQVDTREVPFWMRWLPREPARTVARAGKGSPGAVAALAFRILEQAGMQPSFALLHRNDSTPFVPDIPAAVQFDTLAVLVNDDTGKTHWIVPGLGHDPAQPVPASIKGRKSLVMLRWVADRFSGGGKCWPGFELLFSCYNPSRKPASVKLITVGE